MRRGRRRRRDSGRHDRRGLRTRIDPSTTRNCLRRAIELTAEEVRASALVPGPMKTSNLGDGYWTWRESGLAPAGGAVVERHTLADTERPRHPDSALQNSDGITERSAGLVGGDRPSAGPVRELLDATDQAADALAASTKLAGDGPPEGQPGRARRSGRGLQVAVVASPPGCSNTSAAAVPFDEQGEDFRLAESMVATRGHDRSQSALGCPPVHRSRVHPAHQGGLPGGEQPISAVRGHLPRTTLPGPRSSFPLQVTPVQQPCQTPRNRQRLK